MQLGLAYGGTFLFGKEKRLWKSFSISEKANKINLGIIEMQQREIVIKAVAPLEPKCLIQSNDGLKDYHTLQLGIDSKTPSVAEHPPLNGSTQVDEKEMVRRMRISQANKGNKPWNKGRKHNPETIQRIRERTRIAMQDPKVKMKLVKPAHAQSEATRIKIGVAMRNRWERRRKKLGLQITCHFEWKNLIAEASRRGFVAEEELQWNSYKILDEQLRREWLESVEWRKKRPRRKGSNRASKSPEQRRKISAAILAKWADPEYRDRVYFGLSKYHARPVGAGNKPTRRTNSDGHCRNTSPRKKAASDADNSNGNETKVKNQRARFKRSNMPLYKDPLASSKLEMIENIRTQRAAAENKKTEAIARAKLLIAEAENAVKALELYATSNPSAQSSLVETRKLIAEAIQSIESIKTGWTEHHDNDTPHTSSGVLNHVEKETNSNIQDLSQTDEQEVNRARTLASSDSDMVDFGFGKFKLQNPLDGMYEIDDDKILPSSSCDRDLVNGKGELHSTGSMDHTAFPSELGNMVACSIFRKQSGKLEPNGSNSCQSLLPNGAKPQSRKEERPTNSTTITKKWVSGKLVEVADEDQRLNSESDF